MRVPSAIIATAVATLAAAQRPDDEPICDYYTTALLEENTAENQATLLTLLVNTVVIGNCEGSSTIDDVDTANTVAPYRHNAQRRS
jgi:hypothetical protein